MWRRAALVDSADLLDRIAGPGTVRCFRPPYGNHDATTVRVAKERGLAVEEPQGFASLTGQGVNGTVGGRRVDLRNVRC